MLAKFPFTDFTVSDVSILNPRHRFHATAISLTRLLKRFNNNSTCDIDAVLMEFREYKSLLESHLPACNDSLEQFWNSMGKIPLPAGEVTAKRFGNQAKFCKILLVLPHSTALTERLFSMIGKDQH